VHEFPPPRIFSRSSQNRESPPRERASWPQPARPLEGDESAREEIGAALWKKDGRRILLTDAGKKLARLAPKLLDEFEAVKNQVLGPEEAGNTARIATFEVFSTYFLSFLEKPEWSDHRLEIHEALPGELEKAVAEGRVDLGLTYMPVPHPDLDFLKVHSIEMGVFAREGSFPGLPQTELPFVVPVMPLQGTPTRIRGLDGWPEDAYRRKVKHQVTLLESAIELCRQGRAAGYFPVFIAREHNKRVRPEYQLERKRSPYSGRVCRADVYLVKRKSNEEGKLAKQLAKAVRTVC
jgi:DNA-binding transcriptional LysR family regulator